MVKREPPLMSLPKASLEALEVRTPSEYQSGMCDQRKVLLNYVFKSEFPELSTSRSSGIHRSSRNTGFGAIETQS